MIQSLKPGFYSKIGGNGDFKPSLGMLCEPWPNIFPAAGFIGKVYLPKLAKPAGPGAFQDITNRKFHA